MTAKEFDPAPESTDETFLDVNATGKMLEGLLFDSCSFERCTLSESSLRGTSFFDCTFNDCDLSNIQLTSTRLRDVTFINCKLVGVNWASAAAVSGLSFAKCVLNYSVFEGLDLRKFEFENCIIREGVFADTNLSEAIFRGADLCNTRFTNANLTKADFRKATNYYIRPGENKIKNAKFSLPEATALLRGLEIELEE